MKTAKEILIEARKLIEKPESWVNGGARAGLDGCHCCQTAISVVAGTSEARPALIAFARNIGGSNPEEYYLSEIWQWNDKPWRTHDEVLAEFDRAIAAST